jgi:hypothetical protein
MICLLSGCLVLIYSPYFYVNMIVFLQGTFLLFENILHKRSHFYISAADATNIMRGQSYLHLVVYVEPFRVVIHLFG